MNNLNPSLSVVIPKYNHKQLAIKSMAVLDEYLRNQNINYEIILIDDGSNENEILKKEELPEAVRLIQFKENKGKGHAVKEGVLKAKGKCIIYTDLDLPYDLKAITYSYNLITKEHYDFVAGDRTIFFSETKDKVPIIRSIAHRIYSKIMTLFIIGGIYDSQCGFKAFSRDLSRLLFPLLTISRFGFDVELYYILIKYNIVIKRIPVYLVNNTVTTMNMFTHSLQMSFEIMSIPLKWYLKRYNSMALKMFKFDKYWE